MQQHDAFTSESLPLQIGSQQYVVRAARGMALLYHDRLVIIRQTEDVGSSGRAGCPREGSISGLVLRHEEATVPDAPQTRIHLRQSLARCDDADRIVLKT
jgi:hypothetical protein